MSSYLVKIINKTYKKFLKINYEIISVNNGNYTYYAINKEYFESMSIHFQVRAKEEVNTHLRYSTLRSLC